MNNSQYSTVQHIKSVPIGLRNNVQYSIVQYIKSVPIGLRNNVQYSVMRLGPNILKGYCRA